MIKNILSTKNLHKPGQKYAHPNCFVCTPKYAHTYLDSDKYYLYFNKVKENDILSFVYWRDIYFGIREDRLRNP